MDWTLKLRKLIEDMPREHKNIRTLAALESIVKNLDKIPVEELEKLATKYEL